VLVDARIGPVEHGERADDEEGDQEDDSISLMMPRLLY
jgi:hypothetical protein